MDHYRILEVSPTATREEIRAAYKRLAKMYHPDINKSASAHTLFQHISESYRILYDPGARARYDATRTASYTYREYAPQDPEPRTRQQTAHRRNPHSYRSAPPLRQEDLIRPYMKYAYAVSWFGFILAILLTIDFMGPAVTHQETIASTYVLPGASYDHEYGRPQLIYTEEGTRMEVRAGRETIVLTEGIAEVEKTPILGYPRHLTVTGGQTLEPLVLLYGHLSFFPLLLLLFSAAGAFVRYEIVFDFNVCLVSGVLTVITLVVIAATS